MSLISTFFHDDVDMDAAPGRALAKMVAKIACIVFTLEVIIMVALAYRAGDLSVKAMEEGMLDSTSLTLLSCPLIYLWVVKPFADAARAARDALKKQLDETSDLLRQNERLRLALQKVSENAAETHERTLQKIGADLHDGPAQLLSFVLLRIDSFQRVIEPHAPPKNLADLAELRGVVADTLREIRGISTGLSMPSLSTASLVASVKLAIKRHEELTGSKIGLTIGNVSTTSTLAQKACAYRFVQEALFNVHKHAKAKNTKVTLTGLKILTISVQDDGHGFDPNSRSDKALGLTCMEARIQAMGGNIDVVSRTGKGTTVTAQLNLDS